MPRVTTQKANRMSRAQHRQLYSLAAAAQQGISAASKRAATELQTQLDEALAKRDAKHAAQIRALQSQLEYQHAELDAQVLTFEAFQKPQGASAKTSPHPTWDIVGKELKDGEPFVNHISHAVGFGEAITMYRAITRTCVQIGKSCTKIMDRFKEMSFSQRLFALTTVVAMLGGAGVMVYGIVQIFIIGLTPAMLIIFAGAATASVGVYVANKFLKFFPDREVSAELGLIGRALERMRRIITAPARALDKGVEKGIGWLFPDQQAAANKLAKAQRSRKVEPGPAEEPLLNAQSNSPAYVPAYVPG